MIGIDRRPLTFSRNSVSMPSSMPIRPFATPPATCRFTNDGRPVARACPSAIATTDASCRPSTYDRSGTCGQGVDQRQLGRPGVAEDPAHPLATDDLQQGVDESHPVSSFPSRSATLAVGAMMVRDGLTGRDAGISEASPTYSPATSWDRPFASTAERARSDPIGTPPCMCVVLSPVHRTSRAPHEGKAVLLASTDLAELVDLCDRVLVFRRGRITEEIAAELTEQNLSLAMNASPGEEPGAAQEPR